MIHPEDVVRWWHGKRIETEADLAEAMQSRSVALAYNSSRIENDNVTYRDTEEIFQRGRVSSYTGDVRTLFEIQNAKAADDLFLRSFGVRRPLDESLLLEIHEVLTVGTYDERRWQNGERPGQYKYGEYVVGRGEIGSDPDDVRAEMLGLFQELESSGPLAGANVLTAAAYFHACFENIHPFADGNGRTGRLAMNYMLVLADHPPIVIHEEDRQMYYEALRAWDREQQLKPLVLFLRDQTVKTWKRQMQRPGRRRPKPPGLAAFL